MVCVVGEKCSEHFRELGFHALSSLGVEWFLGFRRVYRARNRSGGSGCLPSGSRASDLVGSEVGVSTVERYPPSPKLKPDTLSPKP